MLTSNLVNKLYTKLVHLDDQEKLLLIASNSERSCLYTFDTKTCIQPVMEHSPFYINVPKETNYLYPSLTNEKSFITGTQILPGKYRLDRQNDDFLTVALLVNNGDIYMQDFWPSREVSSSRNSCTNLDDFKHEQGLRNFFSVDFDLPAKVTIYLSFSYIIFI